MVEIHPHRTAEEKKELQNSHTGEFHVEGKQKKNMKKKLAIVSPFPIRKNQKNVAPLTLGQEEYDVSRCPTFPNGVAHATSLKADSEEPALFGTHAGRAKR